MATPTVGSMIDRLNNIRESKRKVENELKEIEAEYTLQEAALLERLQAEGMEKASGKNATVSVNVSVVPQISDWDAFYAFIHKHKYYHLLERRPSVTGCRELFDTKGAIPGAEKFTKVKLNLRAN